MFGAIFLDIGQHNHLPRLLVVFLALLREVAIPSSSSHKLGCGLNVHAPIVLGNPYRALQGFA